MRVYMCVCLIYTYVCIYIYIRIICTCVYIYIYIYVHLFGEYRFRALNKRRTMPNDRVSIIVYSRESHQNTPRPGASEPAQTHKPQLTRKVVSFDVTLLILPAWTAPERKWLGRISICRVAWAQDSPIRHDAGMSSGAWILLVTVHAPDAGERSLAISGRSFVETAPA